MRTFKTDDGFTLRIFSSGYLDWGLEIFAPNNESVYYNPHCISSESVGFHLEDGQGNEIEEPLPWSDYEPSRFERHHDAARSRLTVVLIP